MDEQVTLVDERDNPIGVEEKLAAHVSGKLHRALSVFVFDRHGRLLLQRRASAKYHSGGLWSNTCCSHPRPGEDSGAAAHRRLGEEMGIACELDEAFSFVYRAALPNGLIEHEYDHVFFGHYDGDPVPDPDEVEAWRWIELTQLQVDIRAHPQAYTYWLAACLERVIASRRRGPA